MELILKKGPYMQSCIWRSRCTMRPEYHPDEEVKSEDPALVTKPSWMCSFCFYSKIVAEVEMGGQIFVLKSDRLYHLEQNNPRYFCKGHVFPFSEVCGKIPDDSDVAWLKWRHDTDRDTVIKCRCGNWHSFNPDKDIVLEYF